MGHGEGEGGCSLQGGPTDTAGRAGSGQEEPFRAQRRPGARPPTPPSAVEPPLVLPVLGSSFGLSTRASYRAVQLCGSRVPPPAAVWGSRVPSRCRSAGRCVRVGAAGLPPGCVVVPPAGWGGPAGSSRHWGRAPHKASLVGECERVPLRRRAGCHRSEDGHKGWLGRWAPRHARPHPAVVLQEACAQGPLSSFWAVTDASEGARPREPVSVPESSPGVPGLRLGAVYAAAWLRLPAGEAPTSNKQTNKQVSLNNSRQTEARRRGRGVRSPLTTLERVDVKAGSEQGCDCLSCSSSRTP